MDILIGLGLALAYLAAGIKTSLLISGLIAHDEANGNYWTAEGKNIAKVLSIPFWPVALCIFIYCINQESTRQKVKSTLNLKSEEEQYRAKIRREKMKMKVEVEEEVDDFLKLRMGS